MRITTTLCLASLFLAGCGEVADQPVSETKPTDAPEANAASETSDPAVVAEYTPVTLEVPTMMCPFACYPTVKETLEEQPGVASVDLVPQKQEGVIDDRRVIVKTNEGFDADHVIAALTEAGYAGAVLEN